MCRRISGSDQFRAAASWQLCYGIHSGSAASPKERDLVDRFSRRSIRARTPRPVRSSVRVRMWSRCGAALHLGAAAGDPATSSGCRRALPGGLLDRRAPVELKFHDLAQDLVAHEKGQNCYRRKRRLELLDQLPVQGLGRASALGQVSDRAGFMIRSVARGGHQDHGILENDVAALRRREASLVENR